MRIKYHYKSPTKYQKGDKFKKEGDGFSFSYINPKNWGVVNYEDSPTFNDAFRRARANNEKEFLWNGNRYSSDLISKNLNEEYESQKNWLKDYINNRKNYSVEKDDLPNVMFSDYMEDSKIKNPDNYEKIKKVFMSADAYKDSDFLVYQDSIKNVAKENLIDDKIKKRLEKFDKPYYTSITSQPSKNSHVGGYHNEKEEKMFISLKDSKDLIDTTPIHEWSHKIDSNKDLRNVPKVNPEILNKLYQNNKIPTIKNQEHFNYLTRPTEIEARKISLLYTADKLGYKNINKETLNKLYKDNRVNNDVKELIDLYKNQEDILIPYLNNEF